MKANKIISQLVAFAILMAVSMHMFNHFVDMEELESIEIVDLEDLEDDSSEESDWMYAFDCFDLPTEETATQTRNFVSYQMTIVQGPVMSIPVPPPRS